MNLKERLSKVSYTKYIRSKKMLITDNLPMEFGNEKYTEEQIKQACPDGATIDFEGKTFQIKYKL